MIKDKKTLLRKFLIFAIIFTAGFIVGLVGLLLGQGLRCLFSFNDTIVSLLRYLFNSYFISALIWWIYGIYLLIALRFPTMGFVFIAISIINGILFMPNINYSILLLTIGNIYPGIIRIVESQLGAIAILLSLILFKLSGNKTISYFIPLCLIALIHILLNFQTGILLNLFIVIQTAIFVIPYFLEKGLQKFFKQRNLLYNT